MPSQSEISRILGALGIEALGYTCQNLLFRARTGQVVAINLQRFSRRHALQLVDYDKDALRRCFPTPPGVKRGISDHNSICTLIEACMKAGMRYADELEALGFTVRMRPLHGLWNPEPISAGAMNSANQRRERSGRFGPNQSKKGKS